MDEIGIVGHVTKETFDTMKARLDHAETEKAQLKAQCDIYNARNLDALAKLQPDIVAFTGELSRENPDWAPEMSPTLDFCEQVHKTQNPDTALSFARMLHCASMKNKRQTETIETLKGKTTTIGETMKQVEELTEQVEKKKQRICELEEHCKDTESSKNDLLEKLTSINAVKDMKDFSKIAAREKGAKTQPHGESNMQDTYGITTENASANSGKQKMSQLDDDLSSFVHSKSSGGGSRLMFPSRTGHALLGNSSTATDMDEVMAYL